MLGSVYDRFHPEDWDEYCEEQEKEDTSMNAYCENCTHLLKIMKLVDPLKINGYKFVCYVCYAPCGDNDNIAYAHEIVTGPVECDAYDPIDDD